MVFVVVMAVVMRITMGKPCCPGVLKWIGTDEYLCFRRRGCTSTLGSTQRVSSGTPLITY